MYDIVRCLLFCEYSVVEASSAPPRAAPAQFAKNSIPNEANNENLIIAYEPIWAIGTGLTPSIKEITEIHNFIKKDITGFQNYKVIYGGSVKSSNSKEILAIENVDGVLVGGASVNIEEFNRIIES